MIMIRIIAGFYAGFYIGTGLVWLFAGYRPSDPLLAIALVSTIIGALFAPALDKKET